MYNDAFGNGTSKGELFMDDGLGTLQQGSKWCYLTFEMIQANKTIVFTDRSEELGQFSQISNCSQMQSYMLSEITVYGYRNFTNGTESVMKSANIMLKNG